MLLSLTILARIIRIVKNNHKDNYKKRKGDLMKNLDIRTEAKNAGVKLWQIADELGMTDGSFSRKLRKELNHEEKAKIRAIIAELKGGN